MTEELTTDEKLDRLIELEEMNARNIYALYRRTTALAHMVEAVADGKEPRLPKVLRAEIDASLNPDAFEALADKDADEFTRRYGEDVLNVLRTKGVDVITKIGDFAPLKSEGVTH